MSDETTSLVPSPQSDESLPVAKAKPPTNAERLAVLEQQLARVFADASVTTSPSVLAALTEEAPLSHSREVIDALRQEADQPQTEEIQIDPNGTTLTLGIRTALIKIPSGRVAVIPISWR